MRQAKREKPKWRRSVCLLTLLLGAVGIGLCGCAPKPDVSKKEEANWKGGPMPADFKMNVPAGPPKAK